MDSSLFYRIAFKPDGNVSSETSKERGSFKVFKE
jgi:hypothetical protein